MARRNIFTNCSTLVFMAVSLGLLSFFEGQRWLYVGLISLAVSGRIISVLMQHRIHSADPSGGRVCSDTWAKDLWRLRETPPLLRYILFGSVAGLFMAFNGPTATLYAFELVKVTPANFTAYSIVATICGTLSVRIWGELIDRHGAIPVLFITSIAWRIGDFGWIVVNEHTKDLLFFVWGWGGAMGTGYMLANFILLLKLIPENNRSAGISLNMTSVSICAAISPMIAGWWLGSTFHAEINPWIVYRGSLAFGFTGCLISTLFLFGIKEPKTQPGRNNIPGALRTLRQLSVSHGLAFFGNGIFVIRKKKQIENKQA